ncbi:protein O-mannosyl-transferase TMTC3-like [Strongylocentrotus purpuratus]|uniref:Transmembrane and TPR repeat-containing protein n=1 Tax=Strongylocentrotus purpuratus TaxID=7668 RepID=A0A7M7P5F6_STRPU|nr:protein O-mannosyl-transferase TMTC3-like [Strongylocentrotus purpuratus]
MGTIPLVTSLSDPRNLATLLLVSCLILLVLYAVFAEEALSFLVLPFLPASNLFFPVGFVVAERVLYAPSIGYCLLVAKAMERLQANRTRKYVVRVIFAIILLLHAGKTIQRNPDWDSNHSLINSALKVTQNNALMWNIKGHALKKENRLEDAITYFNKATTLQPDYINAWINVGSTYQELRKLDEAEVGYRRAIELMPQPRKGEQIDPKHLPGYLNLAHVIQQNKSRLIEAEELAKEAIRRGREANKYFDHALQIDPHHKKSLLQSALYIQESGNVARRQDAIMRLKKLLEIDPPSVQVYSTLALIFMDDEDTSAALHYYQKALEGYTVYHEDELRMTSKVVARRLRGDIPAPRTAQTATGAVRMACIERTGAVCGHYVACRLCHIPQGYRMGTVGSP